MVTDKQRSALFWVMLISYVVITSFTVLGYFTPIITLDEDSKDWLVGVVIGELSIAFIAFLYQSFGIEKLISTNKDTAERDNTVVSYDATVLSEKAQDKLIRHIGTKIKELVNANTSHTDLKKYNQIEIHKILKESLTLYLDKKYPDVSPIIDKKLNELLNNKHGYFKSFELYYSDSLMENNLIKSSQTKKQTLYCPHDNYAITKEFEIKKFNGLTKEECFRYKKIVIDGSAIDVIPEYKNIDGIVIVNIVFPKLTKGFHDIEEYYDIIDTECSHVVYFDKPCLKLKVSYEHTYDITNPVLYEKSGRAVPKKIDGILVYGPKDALMLEDERIFVIFEKREGSCNV